MSVERHPAGPEPDDFERQLRELMSGSAGAAKYTELSAAERARRAARPAPPGRPRRRQARKARDLRGPVPGSGRDSGRPGRRPRFVPAAGAKRPKARTSGRQRLRSAARTAGLVVAFCALLFLLHIIGFGPQ